MSTTAATVQEFYKRVSTTEDYVTVNALAKAHGYDPMALRSSRRHLRYVVGRRTVAKALRAAGWSYPRIGRALGGRHHTTVMFMLGATRKVRKSAAPPQETP
jgi:chromosomal replication initiation ATPase DnaA